MTIISFIATTISISGLPSNGTQWTVLLITTGGTVLVYIAKNWAFPSVSIFGTIDLRDVLSGLILALGTGVSDWVGTLVAGVAIDWHTLWVSVGGVVLGYFVKLFTMQPKTP